MDKKIANPDMLLLARESRGITQTDLAKRLHVSQAAISKAEKLPGKASEALVADIAAELEYPESFFYQTGGRFATLSILHRKRATMPQKIRQRIEANANVTLLHIQHLSRLADLPQNKVPRFSSEEFVNGIEGVAQAVRTIAHLPPGPLSSITILLENLGVILVARDFDSEKLDAFTMTNPDYHVIFFNQEMPWCRIRFSLAHELGHLVLGHIPGQDGIEEEANAFASALLMPKTEISQVFEGAKISLGYLADLKPRWKVSMQALMRRAFDLNFLGQPSYEYLCRVMSIAGFKKQEPPMLNIPEETPGILRHMMTKHLYELGYSKEELCEMLCVHPRTFDGLYPEFAKVTEIQ